MTTIPSNSGSNCCSIHLITLNPKPLRVFKAAPLKIPARDARRHECQLGRTTTELAPAVACQNAKL